MENGTKAAIMERIRYCLDHDNPEGTTLVSWMADEILAALSANTEVRSDEQFTGAGISACLDIIEVTRKCAEVNPWNRPGEKEYVEPAMRHLSKVIGGLEAKKLLADKPHYDALVKWAGERAAQREAPQC